MSSDDQLKFCGTICMAARRMNIYGRMAMVDGKHSMTFWDIMPRTTITGKPGNDAKEALQFGCEALVNYLTYDRRTG